MKKTIVTALFFTILMLVISCSTKTDTTKGSKEMTFTEIAKTPDILKDSIPQIIALIRNINSSVTDTSTYLPSLTYDQNVLLGSYFSLLAALRPEPVPVQSGRDEIGGFEPCNDNVRSVWVDIKSITDCLGVNERLSNPYGYDGFRFYFAKAVNPPSTSDIGKTTLVMVATKANAMGHHEDILSVGSYTGVFNKFDPCPPPTGGCKGTLLFPH